MRELLWVAERELRERRLVLAGAFLIGLLTLASPLLPMVRAARPIVVINDMATMIAVLVSCGVALLAGGSVIGRDLAERRMGFYFSRPLASLSIWAGKILSAMLLAIGSGLLVLVPVTLLGGGLVQSLTGRIPVGARGAGLSELVDVTKFSAPSFLLGFLALIIFLVAFAHATSTVARARSKWILLDIVALPFLFFLFWSALRPLLLSGSTVMFRNGVIAITSAFLVAIVVAGAMGLVYGRSEIRVVHRVLSLTLAAILALFDLCFEGYSIWVRSAGPSDLESISLVESAPVGNWISVTGTSARESGLAAGFLIDTATKKSLSTGGFGLSFSADGTRAVWIRLPFPNLKEEIQEPLVAGYTYATADVMMADLGPNPGVRRTNLTINLQLLREMLLSPDGSRLAMLQNDALSVIEMKSGASLVTARLSDSANRIVTLDFVSNDLMRIYRIEEGAGGRAATAEIFELDIPAKHLSRTGTFEGTGGRPGPQHDLLINWQSQAREFHVVDARTGATIAGLGRLGDGETGKAYLTSRGPFEVVIASHLTARPGQARAELHGLDGRLSRVIDLDPALEAKVAAEPAPGKLVIALYADPLALPEEVILVDLDSGSVRKLERGLIPLSRPWNGTFPQPGSISARLFRQGERLLYFDPLTGERRVIAGR